MARGCCRWSLISLEHLAAVRQSACFVVKREVSAAPIWFPMAGATSPESPAVLQLDGVLLASPVVKPYVRAEAYERRLAD